MYVCVCILCMNLLSSFKKKHKETCYKGNYSSFWLLKLNDLWNESYMQSCKHEHTETKVIVLLWHSKYIHKKETHITIFIVFDKISRFNLVTLNLPYISSCIPIKSIFSVTMETQSSQSRVSCQVVVGNHGDVVEGEIKSQGAVRYHGNAGESTVGAVTGELQVTAVTWWLLAVWVWPLTPAEGREEDEDDEEIKVAHAMFFRCPTHWNNINKQEIEIKSIIWPRQVRGSLCEVFNQPNRFNSSLVGNECNDNESRT